MGNIGIGLIGIAGYGRSHLSSIEACERLGRCTLEAVTVRPQDTEPEMESELTARGVAVYRSVVEMLEGESDRIELIAIPTGIPAHGELTISALEAGYHVLCEKPAAGTYEEALLMQEAALRCNRTLAIGFQYIFTPAIQNLKAVRVDRRLGKLLNARTKVLWPRDSGYYSRNGWAGMIKAGGKRIYDSPTQNAVSHYLNNMLYVAGDTLEESAYPVSLYGENYRAQRIESADTQYLRLTTDNGVEIGFIASHATSTAVGPVSEFVFERGIVRFDASEGSEAYSLESDQAGVRPELFAAQDPAQNRIDAFLDTFDAIEGDRPPKCTIENALPHSLSVQTLFEEACPVRDVAPEHRKDLIVDGEVNTVIDSIEGFVDRMFREDCSFAEAGAPWAAPGRSVKVTRC
jgi:predicted dehydrogenase